MWNPGGLQARTVTLRGFEPRKPPQPTKVFVLLARHRLAHHVVIECKAPQRSEQRRTPLQALGALSCSCMGTSPFPQVASRQAAVMRDQCTTGQERYASGAGCRGPM